MIRWQPVAAKWWTFTSNIYEDILHEEWRRLTLFESVTLQSLNTLNPRQTDTHYLTVESPEISILTRGIRAFYDTFQPPPLISVSFFLFVFTKSFNEVLWKCILKRKRDEDGSYYANSDVETLEVINHVYTLILNRTVRTGSSKATHFLTIRQFYFDDEITGNNTSITFWSIDRTLFDHENSPSSLLCNDERNIFNCVNCEHFV